MSSLKQPTGIARFSPLLNSTKRSGHQGPILALTRDGRALDSDSGPFQIVVPGEQRRARWVRQLACLRIARDRLQP